MKMGARTLQILKNYSTINPSLLFKPGSNLVTMSPSKTMMVKATVAEEFSQQFAIYDLSRLLGVLSLFDDPDLELSSKHLTVNGNGHSVNYTYADISMIEVPPDKEIPLENPEIEFTLTGENLTAIQRALGVLGQPEIAVIGDRDKIYIATMDAKNPVSDQYKIEVGSTSHEFQIVFKAENIKLLNATYQVRIQSKGVGHFKTDDIEYWIVAEATSSFSE